MDTYHHIGPAGHTYESISDAGRQILQTNCHGYITGTSSSLLPPFFINSYPEVTYPAGGIIPAQGVSVKSSQFKDLNAHKIGEANERKVFELISKIAENSNDLLVFHSFNLTQLKCEILKSENSTMISEIDKKKFKNVYGEVLRISLELAKE